MNPIPKSAMMDIRDHLYYRGITLAVSNYNLFCSVMNDSVKTGAEDNNLIADEQNRFRLERKCIDRIHSLVNIVESRIENNQSIFAAFIDFPRAYVFINRDLLWSKLCKLEINRESKLLKALQGIYSNVKCTVNINGCLTEWFNVSVGLKGILSSKGYLFSKNEK